MSMGTGWENDYEPLGGSQDKEDELFRIFTQQIQEVQARFQKDGHIKRGLHAEALLATKKAQLIITSDISEDLRIGFLKPGKAYEAHVRLSNASSGINTTDPNPKDLRGAAIRVMMGPGDDGPYHDFLMTNADPHHARDAREAMAAIVAGSEHGTLAQLVKLIRGAGLFAAIRMSWRVSRQKSKPVESLATETYWSRAAFAFGRVAVKYRLAPIVEKSRHAKRPKRGLLDEITTRLEESEIRFRLQVQRYVDSRKTPIENAAKKWDERDSKFETIAELVLLKQKLGTDEAISDAADIEKLAFNPWHVNTQDFVPLGNMNRSRNPVYWASVKLREQKPA
jgi:hypothetical protein